MNFPWRRSGSAEDRLEAWIAQSLHRQAAAGDMAPPSACPDDVFLRDLAAKSKRVKLSDPRIKHVANCPRCMAGLKILREELRTRRRRTGLLAAATACALIAIFVVVERYTTTRSSTTANMAVHAQKVNLLDAETTRGEQPGSLESVTVPAAMVRLTIILPRHSPPGQYLVAITHDQNGTGLVAESRAATFPKNSQQEITAELDLRRASAGQYFLSTTHEQDQAAYYYPLQIK